MTQTEYEQKKKECWEEAVLHGALEVDKDLLFDHAFKCGYTLGKQEKDAEETVIQGWVAVDDDGDLFLYRTKPTRDEVSGMWLSHECPLDKELFPDLTWESDPIEVEIIIKRKNNENNSKTSA